jgi:mono/diheme cytochrome c family protein
MGMRTTPPDLGDPALQERLDDEALAAVIRRGKGEMPAFGRTLPDEELALVIEHMRKLGR